MIDFSDFLLLHREASLMAVFIILLAVDIFAPEGRRNWLRPLAVGLFAVHALLGMLPGQHGAGFGGMFVSTPMTQLMKTIMDAGVLLMFMQAGEWLHSKEVSVRHGEFYVVTLATLLGMYLMVSAGNFMMLYIGIETASLPLACMAAWNKYKQKSAEAGAKYILISALSSGIMMFGLSYLYGATGTMYFTDMAAVITSSPMVLLGFVFFFTGLAFKLSLVPFHLWTADVYEGAPTAVTAFLSVTSKGAAAFALLITLYQVFAPLGIVIHHMLWALSVITIVVGNLFALRQKDIKRFFAYSSISQAGYIILGVMGGPGIGMTATVYYVLVYLFSNMAAFGVITAVENKSGRTDIAALNGFYKTNPALSLVMMLALFSLAGIPPLAGFFSKFFIFAAAASRGEYLLVFIALINTVISLYYYLLVVRAMFILPLDEHPVGKITTDRYNGAAIVLCAIGMVVLGLASCVYAYIDRIG